MTTGGRLSLYQTTKLVSFSTLSIGILSSVEADFRPVHMWTFFLTSREICTILFLLDVIVQIVKLTFDIVVEEKHLKMNQRRRTDTFNDSQQTLESIVVLIFSGYVPLDRF